MMMIRLFGIALLASILAVADSPVLGEHLIGPEVSAARAIDHPNGESRVLRGQIRRTRGGQAYVAMLHVPVDADLEAVASKARAGVDLRDLATVTLRRETGAVTLDVDSALTLDALFDQAGEKPLEGAGTLSARWEYEPGQWARFDVLRLVAKEQGRGFGFPYVIPSERVPLLYLFEDFFWRLNNQLAAGDPTTNVHWGAHLEELGIAHGTPGEAALIRASLAYESSRPTAEEKSAHARAAEALLDDEEAFKALTYRQSLGPALELGRIVRSLREELRAADTSIDGILAYLEASIRPGSGPSSDKPGGDQSWFDRGDAFCREAGVCSGGDQ